MQKAISTDRIKHWAFSAKWYKYKRAFHVLLVCCGCFALFDLISPVRTQLDYAPLVTAEDGTPLYTFLTQDEQWRMFTPLKEITPELKKAIVFKEDKYFYQHFGINPIAVLRAGFNNIVQRRRTSGASTITMQVARMLSPKKRHIGNKLIEMLRALQIEGHYSKDEILQLYLNLVPYGSNIQGVKAASMLYFGKTPNQLSLAELTALSIIPNKPNALVMGKHNDRIIKERNKWLQRFLKAGIFDQLTVEDALHEPLNAYRRQPPRMTPQFALRMKRAFPGAMEIKTTIDYNIQVKVEEIAAQYTNGLRLHNINNAAVIVVHNPSHTVSAYIGSTDFFDKAHHGQVDGVQAVRSPGSALKPLLYGLAFDHGLVTPKTIMADIQTDFKGYIPENYDMDFRGSVTAEDALRQSLNIPAVKLLEQLGATNMINEMHAAGFQSVWKMRKKLGLSMILGGCGVRLDEMAGMYSAFANDGVYHALKWTQEAVQKSVQTQYDTVRVLSTGANYMLTQILSELRRPDLPNNYANAQNIPQIAWKTGTSYGRRDAWSIGYNKHYTIAVWIGNFSGVGSPEINGAGTATPLLFQLFNAIDKSHSPEWQSAPADIEFRLVCSKSGKVPAAFCTDQITDSYLPGISDNRPCSHLKEVSVSPDEKTAYCTSCVPLAGYKLKLYDNIAPELAAFYETRNITYNRMPEHNPNCTRYFDGKPPYINSLTNGTNYIVTDKGKQQLQLTCAAANDVKTVYWYINDRFLGSAAKESKVLFVPMDNRIKISCTDDKGRNSDIYINVKFI